MTKRRPLCHYCRVAVGNTADHIVPKSIGGTRAKWNIVMACLHCNQEKADGQWRNHCPVCSQAWERFEAEENDPVARKLRRARLYSPGERSQMRAKRMMYERMLRENMRD